MTRMVLPALLCTGSLVACGESTIIEPGQWEMNVSVVRVDAPGMPKGLNPTLPPPQTTRACITPEQARSPGPGLAGGVQSSACASDDYRMADGRISGTMTCTREGVNVRATVSGTYTRETMDLTMNTQSQVAGQNMQMESRHAGRRTGECSS